jgi:hypothetical protein
VLFAAAAVLAGLMLLVGSWGESRGMRGRAAAAEVKSKASAKKSHDRAEDDKEKPEPADNSYCYVCHDNFQEEPLVTMHQREGIGCVKCHGASEKHSGDEDNITPPDIMYPRPKIDAACDKCHDEHDAPAVKVIASWQANCQGKADRNPAVCVDCHGKHHLAVRTRRWDRETGKLISDDGVRMMNKAPEKNGK